MAKTIKHPYGKKLVDFASKEDSEVLVICSKIEEEIAQLDADERNMFLKELGLEGQDWIV